MDFDAIGILMHDGGLLGGYSAAPGFTEDNAILCFVQSLPFSEDDSIDRQMDFHSFLEYLARLAATIPFKVTEHKDAEDFDENLFPGLKVRNFPERVDRLLSALLRMPGIGNRLRIAIPD